MAEVNSTPTTRRSSPQHPAFSLKKAIDHLRQFYDKEHFNPAPRSVAIKHLGFSPTGSTGIRSIAALLHFGLLEEENANGDSLVRVSEIGKKILLAPPDLAHERVAALQKAAFNPKVYKQVWERWGPSLPSDDTLDYYLKVELEFNPKSIGSFLRDFRDTIAFAKLVPTDVSWEDTVVEPGDGVSEEEAPVQDLFAQVLGASPKDGATPMSAPATSPKKTERTALDYPVASGEGFPIAALRVSMPLDQEEFELLEMELDHRLNMLARMLKFKRAKDREEESVETTT